MTFSGIATTFAVTAGPEVIVVGVIILLVFGSAWLPKLARNAGRAKVEVEKAKGEFEKAKSDFTEPFTEAKKTVAEATDLSGKSADAATATAAVKPDDVVAPEPTPAPESD